jgi:hypothetical protein
LAAAKPFAIFGLRARNAVIQEHFQEKWNPVFRPKMRQRNK